MAHLPNLLKLSEAIDSVKLTKLQIAEKCGISRVTLDSVLKGKEIGLYKFLKIVDLLGLKIGYVFDEDVDVEIRNAGRDYVEKGKIEHKGTEYIGTSSEADLRDQIAQLKSQLADKDKIIALYERDFK